MNSFTKRRLLRAAGLGAVAATLPSRVIASRLGEREARMAPDLAAEDIIQILNLEPNATCGFVRLTFLRRSKQGPGGALCRWPPPRFCTLLSGDTGSSGEAPSHSQRPALPLLPR